MGLKILTFFVRLGHLLDAKKKDTDGTNLSEETDPAKVGRKPTSPASGSVKNNNGSGSGPGRPIMLRILRILLRIHFNIVVKLATFKKSVFAVCPFPAKTLLRQYFYGKNSKNCYFLMWHTAKSLILLVMFFLR